MKRTWEIAAYIAAGVLTIWIVFLCDPAYAKPGTTISPMPGDAFCTVNPPPLASVVCDWVVGKSPRHPEAGVLRVRVTLLLTAGGRLKCRVWDLYDPAIGSIRDGRIIATQTVCYR